MRISNEELLNSDMLIKADDHYPLFHTNRSHKISVIFLVACNNPNPI